MIIIIGIIEKRNKIKSDNKDVLHVDDLKNHYNRNQLKNHKALNDEFES